MILTRIIVSVGLHYDQTCFYFSVIRLVSFFLYSPDTYLDYSSFPFWTYEPYYYYCKGNRISLWNVPPECVLHRHMTSSESIFPISKLNTDDIIRQQEGYFGN